jgi:hypothetical protein
VVAPLHEQEYQVILLVLSSRLQMDIGCTDRQKQTVVQMAGRLSRLRARLIGKRSSIPKELLLGLQIELSMSRVPQMVAVVADQP